MGSAVDAKCTCGYHVETVLIGGGMLNYETFCAFPALCHHCAQVVGVNLLDKTPACPQCKSTDVISYDQKELKETEGAKTVASWHLFSGDRVLSLTDGMYLCPSCRKYHLTFQQANFLWD